MPRGIEMTEHDSAGVCRRTALAHFVTRPSAHGATSAVARGAGPDGGPNEAAAPDTLQCAERRARAATVRQRSARGLDPAAPESLPRAGIALRRRPRGSPGRADVTGVASRLAPRAREALTRTRGALPAVAPARGRSSQRRPSERRPARHREGTADRIEGVRVARPRARRRAGQPKRATRVTRRLRAAPRDVPSHEARLRARVPERRTAGHTADGRLRSHGVPDRSAQASQYAVPDSATKEVPCDPYTFGGRARCSP